MRSWFAEVLRVTVNHLSPIKPIVIGQPQSGTGAMGGGSSKFGETIDAFTQARRVQQQQDALRFTAR